MLEKFARYPLTFGPTHIEKSGRLSRRLGGRVEICAKREDSNRGLAFGGNKLRKLEYIIPDAIASNADTLVSIGGVQSKSARAGRTRSQAWSQAGESPIRYRRMPLCTNMAGSALGREIEDDDIVLIEDYAHPAYGIPSDETKEASGWKG